MVFEVGCQGWISGEVIFGAKPPFFLSFALACHLGTKTLSMVELSYVHHLFLLGPPFLPYYFLSQI
jgi:hypothetical protein